MLILHIYHHAADGLANLGSRQPHPVSLVHGFRHAIHKLSYLAINLFNRSRNLLQNRISCFHNLQHCHLYHPPKILHN